MAHLMYHPEMGEKRPQGQIEANLGYYGEHYFLRTPLALKGQGIKFLETETKDSLGPCSQHKAGWHRYKVTLQAFDRLCQQYDVVSELLLS